MPKTSIILFIILIIVIITIGLKKNFYESFDSTGTSGKISILIFVSDTCPHCVDYNNNMHSRLVAWANTKGYELKRIFSSTDTDKLFQKYNIEYVPACLIISDKKKKLLNGQINENNIENAIKTI